ncbi:1-phosphofructokinase [Metabacillus sp. RGM 3146]|uniref:1-phosphofructokinase n=1 Tax=Metabacillus sp. RGM 3146 TaxID=3401092 RepID=UPI003B9CD575
MIYTCTLNPSIDYIVKTNDFKIGGLNRAEQTQFFPGGKGINVSRVLKRLDAQSIALGFAGGFTGDFVKDFLTGESIEHDFLEVQDLTRINVKLKASEETEINGQGPEITEENQSALLQKINGLQSGDMLVIAGSIPSSMSSDFYTKITRLCKETGIHTVIDTSGPALRETFSDRPFLIKPNHHELGELFDTDIKDADEVVFYAKKLLEEGVQNVIVSMAGEGAIFLNDEYTLFADVPKGKVKNSVGAGDSVVAGFIASYIKERDIEDAFRTGVAAGSATAFSDDLCTKEEVEKLKQFVRIKKTG